MTAVQALLEGRSSALRPRGEVEVVDGRRDPRSASHGDDLGLFIGRHGATIDAVQHLAYKVAGPGDCRRPARGRRRRGLPRPPPPRPCSARPTRPPREAVRSGRPVALDAMSASERKVVHEYLKAPRRRRDLHRRATSPTATSSSPR